MLITINITIEYNTMWPSIVKLRSSHTVCAAGERLSASCVLLFWERACVGGLTQIWTILYSDWWELEKRRMKDDKIITVWTAHCNAMSSIDYRSVLCWLLKIWTLIEDFKQWKKGWERLYIRYSHGFFWWYNIAQHCNFLFGNSIF